MEMLGHGLWPLEEFTIYYSFSMKGKKLDRNYLLTIRLEIVIEKRPEVRKTEYKPLTIYVL